MTVLFRSPSHAVYSDGWPDHGLTCVDSDISDSIVPTSFGLPLRSKDCPLSFVAQPNGAGDVVVKSRSPLCRTDEERDANTI